MLNEADRIEIREMIQEEIENTKYDIMELMQTVSNLSNRCKDHKGQKELVAFNEKEDYTVDMPLRYLEENGKNEKDYKEYEIVVEKLTREQQEQMGTTDTMYTYGDDDITVKYIDCIREENGQKIPDRFIEVYSKKQDITVLIDIDTGHWYIDEVS